MQQNQDINKAFGSSEEEGLLHQLVRVIIQSYVEFFQKILLEDTEEINI